MTKTILIAMMIALIASSAAMAIEDGRGLMESPKTNSLRPFFGEDRAREIPPAQLEAARLRYKEAAARALKARADFDSRRTKIKSLQEDAREACAKGTNDIKRCEKTRSDISEAVKLSLSSAADTAIESLNKLLLAVERSEHLSDKEADLENEMIEARIEEIRQMKESLSNLTEVPKINSLAASLKEEIDLAKQTTLLTSERLNNAKLATVIEGTRQLDERLIDILGRAQAAGKDVKDAEMMRAAMQDKIDEAAKAYADAEKLLSQRALGPSRTRHNQAKMAISAAHDQTKAILKELKKAGLEKELSAEANR